MPLPMNTFEDLLEAVPDALVGVDQSGTIRFVNHLTESLFGYERDELVGATLETLVPESFGQVHAAHRKAYYAAPRRRAMGTDLLLRGRRADGTEFPVDISLSTSGNGDAMMVLAAVRDMTEREKALRETETMTRRLAVIEFSADAIVRARLDGSITSWNLAAERPYGYSSQEMVGKSAAMLSPSDRTGEISSVIATITAGENLENFETLRVRKNGTAIPVAITFSPVRDPGAEITGVSMICRDVAQQRESFENAQRMAAIVENSQDAIIATSSDDLITSWNPAAEKMFGWSGQDIIGRPGRLILLREGQAAEPRDLLATVRAGTPVEPFETVLVRKDGTPFTASMTVSPISDASGTVTGMSRIIRDLTRQKEASELSRSMIEASLDSMVSISPEGKITDANAATVRLTGPPRDQLIGTSFSSYFTDPERAEKVYQRVFQLGSVTNYPLTLRHDGARETHTEVLYNASVHRDARGEVLGVFAAARDVTQQMQAQREAERQQARELERLAELERFQRLTVGRELKMIELKKEIENLRKSRPDHGEESDDQR